MAAGGEGKLDEPWEEKWGRSIVRANQIANVAH